MSLHLSSWQQPDQGALFVVTGASGTGKTTLVKEALRVIPGLQFSVSATTRAPRRGERQGVDYHFVNRTRFDSMVQSNEMLEFAEVYGNHYGTPRVPIEKAFKDGVSTLLDIDTQGAEQVRSAMPEAVTIFILPPSLKAIETRLRTRSTDAPEVIARRIKDAKIQMEQCGTFDYLVVNDDLASAHDQFQAIIIAELLRKSRHDSLVEQFRG